MPLTRSGIIDNHQGFQSRFGRVVDRIGRPTPLNVVPWELYRRDRYVYGDHTYVDGVQYYYWQSFPSKDAAVEAAQEHVVGRSARSGVETLAGESVEFTNVALNIDGSPPTAIITFKNREYHVLTDDTADNYQRQQQLLRAWRASVDAGNPDIFAAAYWGDWWEHQERPDTPSTTIRKILQRENGVDTSRVPEEVLQIMERIGPSARTSEEETAAFLEQMRGYYGQESPVIPRRREVRVRNHKRRQPQ